MHVAFPQIISTFSCSRLNSELTLNITETKREIYTHVYVCPTGQEKKLILSCAHFTWLVLPAQVFHATRHSNLKNRLRADAS
jgi:hypothetical protein